MQLKQQHDHLFKIIIIGDSTVGKTCILARFSDDFYTESALTTIGIDFKTRTLLINNKIIKLQIWDTAGQERFRTITTTYYRGSNAIFLVYDITSKDSFDNIITWLTECNRHASTNVTKMLLGNKCDAESQRQITYEQGKNLADKNNIEFMETSAKENTNIQEAFMRMADLLMFNCIPIKPKFNIVPPSRQYKSYC